MHVVLDARAAWWLPLLASLEWYWLKEVLDIPDLECTLPVFRHPSWGDMLRPLVSIASVLRRLVPQPGPAVLLWKPPPEVPHTGTTTVECAQQFLSNLPQYQSDLCWRGPWQSVDRNTDKDGPGKADSQSVSPSVSSRASPPCQEDHPECRHGRR